MLVDSIDHFVLTVQNVETTAAFYAQALGAEVVRYRQGEQERVALQFGTQKINLHQVDQAIPLRAAAPSPGSGDFCFVTRRPLAQVAAHLRSCGVKVVEGPVVRNGARGQMMSLYFRDPDGNLVEVANYEEGAAEAT